jgi:hypothetical protein
VTSSFWDFAASAELTCTEEAASDMNVFHDQVVRYEDDLSFAFQIENRKTVKLAQCCRSLALTGEAKAQGEQNSGI